MKLFSFFISSFGLLLLVSQPAYACLHPGKDFSSTPVTQSAQQALIFHDGDMEELILSVQYKSTTTVDSLAWIIPVPNVPTEYGTADPKLFSELHSWARLRRESKNIPKSTGLRRKSRPQKKSSIRLLPPTEVGPYRIQPIQASGTMAMQNLNLWMSENGFSPLPEDGLRYYIERNWTFLAIQILPSAEESSLSNKGTLPPLRVRFPSPNAVFPLKFSTHMGEFNTQLYLISNRPYTEREFQGARDRGFEVVSMDRYYGTARFSSLPLSARRSIQKNALPKTMKPLMTSFFGNSNMYLSVLVNEHINTDRIPTFNPKKWSHAQFRPTDWSEDLSIPGLKNNEKLFGAPIPTPPAESTSVQKPTPASEEKPPQLPTPNNASPESGCSTNPRVISWGFLTIFGMMLCRCRTRV